MELTYQQTIIVLSVLIGIIALLMYYSGPNAKRIHRVKELIDRQVLKRGGRLVKSVRGTISIEYPLDDLKINLHIVSSYSSRHVTVPGQIVVDCELLRLNQLVLSLCREDSFQRAQKLLGAQDIQVGSERFDKEFMVKGDDSYKVVALLSTDMQERLLRIKQYDPEILINNKTFSFSCSVIPEEEELFDLIVETAEEIIRRI